MKFLKGLILTFILSIVCLHTGASAWVYTHYSTPLKALKGATVQAEKTKVSSDEQILIIDKVNGNVDIDFRISHKDDNNSKWIDSTWQFVDITSSYPKVLNVHGGLFSGNQYIAISPGIKKLTMRTHNPKPLETGLRGAWWLSKNDYNQYLEAIKK